MKKKEVSFEKRRCALKKGTSILGVSLGVLVLFCLFAQCENAPLKPVSVSITTKPVDQLIREKCSTCHTIDKVKDYEGDDWKEVVDRMIKYGTKLTEGESANVIAYLKEGKSF
ncbi:MAG: hypothetical protein Q8O92_11885 [Candidatus Latescibacter sp.]|nr:hypothetical protein [Candidatus Latescibacter sp.]